MLVTFKPNVVLFSGKSPQKITPNERKVIDCLKQLTDLIFKPHYKGFPSNEHPMTHASEEDAEMVKENQPNSINQEKMEKIIENAMSEGEKFCAMVVQELHTEVNDDWHKGQLNVYHRVHNELFKESNQQQ